MPLSVLKSVLHLEDEFLIAMDVAATLADAGVANVTHVTSCAEALELLESSTIDAGILDAVASDGSTEPVARRLSDLGIPFIMYTGSPHKLGNAHQGADQLIKPVSTADLVGAMQDVLLESKPKQS